MVQLTVVSGVLLLLDLAQVGGEQTPFGSLGLRVFGGVFPRTHRPSRARFWQWRPLLIIDDALCPHATRTVLLLRGKAFDRLLTLLRRQLQQKSLWHEAAEQKKQALSSTAAQKNRARAALTRES